VKRYIPEIIKRPIRKRRANKKRENILNRKHPEILVMETTTRCNASCFYCGRPKTNHDMDFELFKAIIDLVPNTKEIHLNTRGEPLLYPHLIEALEYCKERDKRVQFYTNGSLLTRRLTEQLFNAGLDRIIFSIDDCNPIRYGLSRSGLDFFKVVRNVRRMVALRDGARLKTEIFVRATLTDLNREHQKEIKEFWGDDYGKNSADAPNAYNVFASKEDLKDPAKLSEVGNNPLMVRLLAAVGKNLSEDEINNTNAPGEGKADIQSLMKSDAYRDPKHPDNARTKERVSKYFEKKFPEAR